MEFKDTLLVGIKEGIFTFECFEGFDYSKRKGDLIERFEDNNLIVDDSIYALANIIGKSGNICSPNFNMINQFVMAGDSDFDAQKTPVEPQREWHKLGYSYFSFVRSFNDLSSKGLLPFEVLVSGTSVIFDIYIFEHEANGESGIAYYSQFGLRATGDDGYSDYNPGKGYFIAMKAMPVIAKFSDRVFHFKWVLKLALDNSVV